MRIIVRNHKKFIKRKRNFVCALKKKTSLLVNNNNIIRLKLNIASLPFVQETLMKFDWYSKRSVGL